MFLYRCFRGPSAGRLLLETEGSFRERIYAHGLLVTAGRKSAKVNQQRPFRELLLEKHLPQTFCEPCAAAVRIFWSYVNIYTLLLARETPATQLLSKPPRWPSHSTSAL